MTFTHSSKRSFIDDICEFCAGSAGCRSGNGRHINAWRHFDVTGMHVQYRNTSLEIGQFNRNTAVKTARTQQRGIKDFRPVGRRKDNNALRRVETVHFCQQLIQRLFALIVAAGNARGSVTLLADRIDFVDEYDTRRFFSRLFEEVAHLGRAHTDEHFNEFGAAD